MLMILGQFVFQPDTLSFNELQRNRSWNYASNPVAKGRAKLQFIGVGDETISVSGLIYEASGFGTRAALDQLVKTANRGGGHVLMDGSGYLYGVYVIDGIDETRSVLMFNGVPRKIDFTIKLTRVDEDKIESPVREITS
jgi:phage protein U